MGTEPRSASLKADTLTTRPTRRWLARQAERGRTAFKERPTSLMLTASFLRNFPLGGPLKRRFRLQRPSLIKISSPALAASFSRDFVLPLCVCVCVCVRARAPRARDVSGYSVKSVIKISCSVLSCPLSTEVVVMLFSFNLKHGRLKVQVAEAIVVFVYISVTS